MGDLLASLAGGGAEALGEEAAGGSSLSNLFGDSLKNILQSPPDPTPNFATGGMMQSPSQQPSWDSLYKTFNGGGTSSLTNFLQSLMR